MDRPMDENEQNELSEQEADEILREAIGDSAEEPPISEAKANRFYDRLRTRISSYLERGKAPSVARDALLFVPDTFILLTRLARDPRVTGKNKVILGSAIAYFIFPLDLMPDFIGPIGYLDDLVFAVYVLNRMLADTEARRNSIVRPASTRARVGMAASHTTAMLIRPAMAMLVKMRLPMLANVEDFIRCAPVDFSACRRFSRTADRVC